MSSRKKPRPSFDLPEDIDTGGHSSGWVYRSENGGHKDHGRHKKNGRAKAPESGSSMVENGSYAIAYGVATMSQAMALAMTIATLPLAIGARVIEDWVSEGRATSTARPASDAPSQPA